LLYARWMRELLGDPVPGEAPATCDDCAMCAPKGAAPAASELFYNPETKCCTYVPELPNYLVGRILSDPDPSMAFGRRTVLERLRAGAGVTPLGIAQPAVFEVLYKSSPGSFGRARSLRCPHYIEEGGLCGVWRHRASVCATWYCKYERGALGQAFWKALHTLLSAAQRVLARWCVRDLDPEVLAVLFPPVSYPGTGRALDAADIDGRATPEFAKAAWGAWLGREEEFYRDCARRVDRLSWKEIRVIGGSEIDIPERLLRAAWAEHRSTTLPATLRPGGYKVVHDSPEQARITSYSEHDPLELPRELLEALGYFDGRPTAEALKAIAEEKGLDLDRDLVRRLVDFRILLP